MPLRRDFAALIAVCSLFCAQGCYAYQRQAVGTVPGAGARVRMQSAEPFAVRPAPSGDTAVVAADCRATLIEGFTTSASKDAVTFESLTRVVPADSDRASCRWTRTDPVIVATNGADVTVNRVDGTRTVVVLTVLIVTFVAYVAYGFSQIDWSSSGGRCSRIC
jgi:hypothetical protein